MERASWIPLSGKSGFYGRTRECLLRKLLPVVWPAMGFESEQGGAIGIDHPESPTHQGVAVRFDTGEAEIGSSVAVAQGLVDAADMRVAMDGHDLPREFAGLFLNDAQ